ncbi:hypothetical protein NPIL_197771, partial [Nephila pilipes]
MVMNVLRVRAPHRRAEELADQQEDFKSYEKKNSSLFFSTTQR